MKNFDARVYSISDFLEWRGNQLLDLSPNFQRRGVWTRPAKSFLMDTILRGKPMPKIIITQELREQKTVRTVVDGQQRLRSIFDFVADGFSILRSQNEEFGGKRFSELPREVQSAFLQYEIGVDLLFNVDLPDLLDIFARINTYSVTLNSQEKLNAKYLGIFKTYAYELGHAYASYFREGNVLTEKSISRMGEARLSSDVLVALCDGIQTNKNIEKYYKLYETSEDVPEELAAGRALFHKTMAYVGAIYPPENIRSTNWARQHWFYTLFTVVAHALRPLKGLEDIHPPALTDDDVERWRVALDDISAKYDEFTADGAPDAPRDLQQFIDFARRRTTDTEARLERARYVLRQISVA
jgi:hypothetical protein